MFGKSSKFLKIPDFQEIACFRKWQNFPKFPIFRSPDFKQTSVVNNCSSGVHHSKKMRPIKCFIWLLWLLVINAELTLESVNREVNDLEVEMTAVKVLNINGYHKVDSKQAQNVHNMGTSVGS